MTGLERWLDQHRQDRAEAGLQRSLRPRPARRQLIDLALPLDRLVHRWLDAYNRRDLEALLALFADDAVHTSPKLTTRELRGKAALREWWSTAMQRLPSLHYAFRHLTVTGDRAVLEYERQNPGDPPLAVAQIFVRRGHLLIESHVHHG